MISLTFLMSMSQETFCHRNDIDFNCLKLFGRNYFSIMHISNTRTNILFSKDKDLKYFTEFLLSS